MSDSTCAIILPSLTDQMILGVFKYLVEEELRKSVPTQGEFRFGCQEGMIAAIVLMFGEADDATAETAYDNGGTWLHIVGEIKQDLQYWADTFENTANYEEIDFESFQDAVDAAVNEYALKHPKKLGDALRVNL